MAISHGAARVFFLMLLFESAWGDPLVEDEWIFSGDNVWPPLGFASFSMESFFKNTSSNGFGGYISSSIVNGLLHFLHLAVRPIISGFIRYRWLHVLFGQTAIMVRPSSIGLQIEELLQGLGICNAGLKGRHEQDPGFLRGQINAPMFLASGATQIRTALSRLRGPSKSCSEALRWAPMRTIGFALAAVRSRK
jgi:hypothetical protein